MTDTEKLNKLIAYIQDAERYAFEKGNYESSDARMERVCAIQDITAFIEHELGMELEQLEIDSEKASKAIPNKPLEKIKELAREIGEVPSAYLEGLNDAAMLCLSSDVSEVLMFRNCRKSWKSKEM